MTLLTEDEMYNALLNKDSGYEGIFFVAVKTTGIFCRPTCTARKPKKENVTFYSSIKESLDNGYRACKICKPLELSGAFPDYIEKLISVFEGDDYKKITDYGISQLGIDPYKVRRWFKKNHGISFQAFQRMTRINKAIGNIKYGDDILTAGLLSGYESHSGFNHSFKKLTNFNPSEAVRKNVITITRITTPLGPMVAGATDEGICLFEFADRPMLETELKQLEKILSAPVLPGKSPYFDELSNQIAEYFAGKRSAFNLPILFLGTKFQQQVWQALTTIKCGETRSYKEQAILIGNPLGVRAVGKANGDNRISILIPCHRVIGENGKLTGYGGGLWRKEWLLNHEKKFYL